MKTRKWSQKELDVPATTISLINLHKTFPGGQIASHIHEWERLTSDTTILQMVKRDIIDVEDKIPLQYLASNPKSTSQEELLSN